ncbi:MAG TPA: hypothetical protein VF316_24580 [Polyangiaceae bacterium]
MSRNDKVLYDRLAKTLRGMGADRLALSLGKSESVKIRVTAKEKATMKAMATRYGLTLTDYLIRLHGLVQEITETKKGRTP